MEGNILKVIISVTPLCWHAKKHMAPFLPSLLQIYIQAIMQKDKFLIGDRNKERELIFTWPTALQCETRANKSKFPGWSTISSYLLALERKLRGRIRSDIWRLYNLQCQSEMPLLFKIGDSPSVKYSSGQEWNANVANVSIGIRNALAAYGLWN